MRRIVRVYFVISIVIALIGTSILGYWLYGYIASSLEYQRLQEYVHIQTPENSVSDTESQSDAIDMKRCLGLDIDWVKLKAVNEHVIGWLYVPAVNISYPLMQGEDNEYYLHRTTNDSYLFAGSIFLDYYNTRKLSDNHSLIYGHNMRDGSMFGRLKELANPEVLETDPTFWICTREQDYQYEIFSVHTATANSSTYQFFMNNSKDYGNWIRKMKDASSVNCDVKVSRRDKVVTLSTCTSDSGVKQVVQGVRR